MIKAVHNSEEEALESGQVKNKNNPAAGTAQEPIRCFKYLIANKHDKPQLDEHTNKMWSLDT